jgi:hypothetical protein
VRKAGVCYLRAVLFFGIGDLKWEEEIKKYYNELRKKGMSHR